MIGKYLYRALLAWLLVAIVIVLSIVSLVRQPGDGFANGNWLRIAGNLAWLFVPAAFTIVGALIVSRQSRNVIGWLLVLPGVGFVPSGLLAPVIGNIAVPPANPSLLLFFAVWLSGTGWVLVIFPLFFIALLFPTGRPLSPRWRWVVVYGIGLVLFFYGVTIFAEQATPDASTGVTWTVRNPIGFIPQETIDAIFSTGWGIALVALAVLSAASLIVRVRRARGVERDQIKWMLSAAAFFAVVYVPLGLLQADSTGLLADIANLLLGLAVLGFPIAIGIAILRHRLFDIDLIIRRTLVYGIVTAALLLLYFASIVVLERIFSTLTGQSQNELVTVLSTLAIAALFIPLRNRVQEIIDRRFYRRRYDMPRVLEAFAQAARDETDLDRLTARLVDVVDETMQPRGVSVWLREGSAEPRRQRMVEP